MRWLGSLGALGLMMALFHRLTAAGPLEARATLALGFLLLAAHLGGDIAKSVRLPRITGYLVVGFATGPAWLGFVRADEVAALAFISNAAVALIAFAAGTELKLETLRRERRGLARVASAAILAPFCLVTTLVLAASPWFPLTVHQPWGDRVTIALALGMVASAFSPAVTMAVMHDLGARGPFARTILSVSVAGDVALIVLLSLFVALSRLASAGALDVSVVVAAVLRLVASIVVGVAQGFILARYLRLVRRDTPLFLVAIAVLTAEVARLLGLETMLVALATGFYLENFSRVEGERLRSALERGSLPVYVVFFALAGAGFQVRALAELWPWVLVIVALRAASIRTGLAWAARSPSVTPALARYGWLGLISQAGLALGLGVTARRAFPEWGISLEALIVALIAVHELLGPVGFRRALVRAGEVKEGEHVGGEPLEDVVPVPARGGGSL